MTEYTWPIEIKPFETEFWLGYNVTSSTSIFTGDRRLMLRDGEKWISRLSIRRLGNDARAFDAFLDALKGGVATVLVPDFRRLAPGSGEYRSYQAWIDDIYGTPFGTVFDTGAYWDIGETLGDLLAESGRRLIAEDGSPLAAEGFADATGDLLAEDGDRIVAENDGGIRVEAALAVFVSETWAADTPEPVLLSGAGSSVTIAGVAPNARVFLAGDLIQTSPGRAHEIAADATSDDYGQVGVTIVPPLRTPVVAGPLVFPARARMRLRDPGAARNRTRRPVNSSYDVELIEETAF